MSNDFDWDIWNNLPWQIDLTTKEGHLHILRFDHSKNSVANEHAEMFKALAKIENIPVKIHKASKGVVKSSVYHPDGDTQQKTIEWLSNYTNSTKEEALDALILAEWNIKIALKVLGFSTDKNE